MLSTQPLIVVCSHHKAGTVWLQSIFKKISKKCKLNFYSGKQDELPTDADIFFQNHSKVNLESLQARFPGKSIRGIHIIRDPRDIVISATFYHQTSSEQWLLKPQPKLANLSYQQKLKSLSTDKEKFIFEMGRSSKKVIDSMTNWNYTNPCFYELRYEALINDESLEIFKKAFTHLGFFDESLTLALKIAYENSVFSGKVSNPSHIRSGKTQQWKEYWDEDLISEFNFRFPFALEKLNY